MKPGDDAQPGDPRQLNPWVALTVLLVVTAIHWRLLEGPGFVTDDYPALYARTAQYWKEIRTAGWPRILPDATRGGGNAFPTFYPPLTPVIAALAYGATGKLIAGVHLVGWLSVALSGLSLLALARGIGLTPLASLAGAIAYVAAPYRFALLQQRGSLAEAWVYVFIPLVLLGGLRLAEGERPPGWWPVSLAALLVTQVVVGGWAILVLAGVVLLAMPRRPRRDQWTAGIAGLAVAFGLAGPYLIPMLAGMGETRLAEAERIWTDLPTIEHQALAFAELVGMKRRSLLMRLEFGPLFLALPIAVAAVIWWLRRRGMTSIRSARLLAASFLACAGLFAVMMFPGAALAILPEPFRMIQFPWRLLVLANLLGAVTLALVLDLAPRRVGTPAAIVAAVTLALGGLKYGSEPLLEKRYVTDVHVRKFLYDPAGTDHGWTSVGEHLPRGTHEDWLGVAVDRAKPGPGNDVLERWTRVGSGYAARVRLSSDSAVTLPLVAYPLWRVQGADGARLRTETRAGLLTVPLGAGIHELVIERRLTAADWLGLLIGAVSLLGYLRWLRSRGPTRSQRRRRDWPQPAPLTPP